MSDEIDTLRALLLAQAQRLWTAHLIGNAPPAVERQREEMRAPVVGDFVAVLPVLRGEPHDRFLGVLREVTLASEGSPIDFVIERLDGKRFRWENATAVKLFASSWAGTPPLVAASPVQETPPVGSDTVGR